jgi:hypothetical protein
MKKIEGIIFIECDVCWKKVDWVKKCVCCGHTVCMKCLIKEKCKCPVCEGNFHQPFPNKIFLSKRKYN